MRTCSRGSHSSAPFAYGARTGQTRRVSPLSRGLSHVQPEIGIGISGHRTPASLISHERCRIPHGALMR